MSKLELELDLTPFFAKELELSEAPKKSERDPPLQGSRRKIWGGLFHEIGIRRTEMGTV